MRRARWYLVIPLALAIGCSSLLPQISADVAKLRTLLDEASSAVDAVERDIAPVCADPAGKLVPVCQQLAGYIAGARSLIATAEGFLGGMGELGPDQSALRKATGTVIEAKREAAMAALQKAKDTQGAMPRMTPAQ